MKIPASLTVLFLALVSSSSLPLSAQPAPAPAAEAAAQVEVTGVKYNAARFGGDNWLEAEVEVAAKPGGRAVSGQFVDRVRVTLNLGFEATNEKGEKRKVYYRSSVEAIALEGGSKSVFRFYLPPEVIRRDKLRGDADYHAVELEVAGRPLVPVRANLSSEIKNPDILRSFLTAVNADSATNDGILVPQHLSPFATDPQRRAPSVMRRESSR